MTQQIQLHVLEFLFSFLKSLNSYNQQHAPSVKIVLRLRPRKGEGRVRSRSTCETLVIGQFFRRARDFPPNAEKKNFMPSTTCSKVSREINISVF